MVKFNGRWFHNNNVFVLPNTFLKLSSKDTAVQHKKHLNDLVEMMYKELMILGLVAFGLFSIQFSGILYMSSEDKHIFGKLSFSYVC